MELKTEFQNVHIGLKVKLAILDIFQNNSLLLKLCQNCSKKKVSPGEDVAKGIEGGGGNLQLGF